MKSGFDDSEPSSKGKHNKHNNDRITITKGSLAPTVPNGAINRWGLANSTGSLANAVIVWSIALSLIPAACLVHSDWVLVLDLR